MLEVVGKYVRVEKKGARYWALCPFHNEKTPSFSVSPDKQLYYCFGCQAKGTLFTFRAGDGEGLLRESVRILAEKAGVRIPNEGVSPEEDRKRAAVLELNARVAGSFAHILLSTERGEKARNYLVSRVYRPELVARFGPGLRRIGPALAFWLPDAEELLAGVPGESGLFLARAEPDGTLTAFFRDRLNVPHQVPPWGDRGVRGARLRPRGPQVPQHPETPSFRKGETLYGLHEALEAIKRRGASSSSRATWT